jgi:hypothetical protein
MGDVIWRDPQAREVFARAGFVTLRDFAGCTLGQVVTGARTRWLRRVPLDGTAWFVKVQDLRGVSLPWQRWPSLCLRGSPVAREARALDALRGHGFRTPDIVASGHERGWFLPRIALLVTRAVEGHVDLVRWLEGRPAAGAVTRTLDAADALVRNAHEHGLVLLGAKYRNLLVPAAGVTSPDQIVVLDQPDLRVSRSARLRRKDWRLLRRDRDRYAPG